MKYLSLVLILFATSCASGPEVKKTNYAKLKSERTFESELPVVWKAAQAALKNNKIVDKDEEATEASLETDWVYSQSRDKYHEYKVNGSPRKKPLQTRIKYHVALKRVIGGTDVQVRTDEEVEQLKDDGTSRGYSSAFDSDSSRASELLDKINQSILSAAP